MKWWFKKQQPRQPKLMEGQQGYVFRRSRTLTGSTSEKVNPSAEKAGQLKTERLKSHERRAMRKGFIKTAAVWAGLACVVVFLISVYIKDPQIIFIAGAEGRSSQDSEYKNTLNDYMNKNPLQHFGFSLSSLGVATFVKQHHSEVDDVIITRNWVGGDVAFNVRFRKPLIVWRAGDQNFYVDGQGEAFTYNHYTDPKLVVTDQSGIKPDASGGTVASSRFIKFLGQLIGDVEAYGLGKVTEVVIPPSTREIHLKIENRDYLIKTHIDRDAAEQAEDIANSLKHFDSSNTKPQYIDVRVAGKAFYK